MTGSLSLTDLVAVKTGDCARAGSLQWGETHPQQLGKLSISAKKIPNTHPEHRGSFFEVTVRCQHEHRMKEMEINPTLRLCLSATKEA